MSLQLVPQGVAGLGELVRLERHAFAAKLRVARAVLGWSQSEFAVRVGLTQRAVHKLEQGDTEPRRMTVHAIAAIWRRKAWPSRTLATVDSASPSARRCSRRTPRRRDGRVPPAAISA